MLIAGAEIGGVVRDLRVQGARIAAIARVLTPLPGERVIAAGGRALLPGLHDHHIHLNATAAAFGSVHCGPPVVCAEAGLITALHAAPGDGWLRGIGYHDSLAGAIDRDWLDRFGPDRPLRIQHRGGRMWILNSHAMALLGLAAPADGRLIDGDALLRDRLGGVRPDLEPLGEALAARGVTGLTDATARNDGTDFRHYAAAGLAQHLLVMGGPALAEIAPTGRVRRGALKLHYHDHDLPSAEALAAEIADAHAVDRPVAAHCVTRAELLLTLAAIEAAGPHPGDRIEHAAIAPPEAVAWIAALGLSVVTQPHFIAERGAAYRAEVHRDDLPWLYRLHGFRDARIRLAAGSDAPFGGLDPWASMAAAVTRDLGPEEALSPEEALGLYLGSADDPGGPPRRVAIGEPADLCLIDRPWARARANLAAVRVCATLVDGVAVHTIASTSPQLCAVAPPSLRIDNAI